MLTESHREVITLIGLVVFGVNCLVLWWLRRLMKRRIRAEESRIEKERAELDQMQEEAIVLAFDRLPRRKKS